MRQYITPEGLAGMTWRRGGRGKGTERAHGRAERMHQAAHSSAASSMRVVAPKPTAQISERHGTQPK